MCDYKVVKRATKDFIHECRHDIASYGAHTHIKKCVRGPRNTSSDIKYGHSMPQ